MRHDLTPSKRYQAFILDADNTIFDFNRAEKAALREALLASGYESFPEELFSRYHRINDELWKLFEQGLIDQQQLRIERFRRLIADLPGPQRGTRTPDPSAIGERYIKSLSGKGYLLAHAPAVLKSLSLHVPLLLLSNGIASVQRRRIERSGIGKFLKHILISEEVGTPVGLHLRAVSIRCRSQSPCTRSLICGSCCGSCRLLSPDPRIDPPGSATDPVLNHGTACQRVAAGYYRLHPAAWPGGGRC